MKNINILLLTILFITSCQSGDTEKIVTIENKYSISIPSFLVKASTELNEDASLQYLHTWKEFYVIVIDESKSEMQKALIDNNLTNEYSNDIEGYSDLLLDGFEEGLSIYNKSDIIDTEINNMPAKLLAISGRIEGVDVYYSLAFIEEKERYYQIMAWTLLNKESKYKAQMKKIMNSLKEL